MFRVVPFTVNKKIVKNHFVVINKSGAYLESNAKVIAYKDQSDVVHLDSQCWDRKEAQFYLTRFLGEKRRTTNSKVLKGVYLLRNLNA